MPPCPTRPSCHGRCSARFWPRLVSVVPPIVAPCCGDHRGAFAFAIGLTGGEELPVSARVAGVKVGGWRWQAGPDVSDSAFKWKIFYFHNWMNSIYFCYFCVDLFKAPKIIKIFVWHLCDVYYLTKIWNVIFQYFLNVMKIAQFINKWISMIFLGWFNCPKIMKFVLPLNYHVINIYKKFEVN